jgi:surface carbohydrate biosynthesis protein
MIGKFLFIRLYKIFFLKKKILYKPKKSNILIYDNVKIDVLQKLLGNLKYKILDIRCELNIYVLILCLFKFKFQKIDYISEYINKVNPKVLITCSDNDINFYQIKNLSKKKLLTIAIQNGYRGITKDIFEHLQKLNKKRQLTSDWILTFNKKIGSQYQKYISTNIFPAGNIRNNFNTKQPLKRKKNSILLISQYVKKSDKAHLESMSCLFKFLLNYVHNNSKTLGVLLRNQEDEDEKFFFTKHGGKKKFHFINKNLIQNSYYWIDIYEITVTINSTLGYESLSRGNKTAFLNTRSKLTNQIGENFGWPANYPKKGSIWSDKKNFNYFNMILDNLFSYSSENLNKILKDIKFDQCMIYDENNLKLKLFLKNLFDKLGIK